MKLGIEIASHRFRDTVRIAALHSIIDYDKISTPPLAPAEVTFTIFRHDRSHASARHLYVWLRYHRGNLPVTADQSDAQGVEAFLECPIF